VQRGTYRVLAYLYGDPQNFRPRYDLLYRFGSAGDFASLYEDEPEYPRLSKARPVKNDPSPSWDKVAEGKYTDLQLAATYTAGGNGAQGFRGVAEGPAGGPAFSRSAAAEAPAPQITAAQMATLRRLAAERHAARLAGRAAPSPSATLERALRRFVPAGGR
jgi:hypothetical protein